MSEPDRYNDARDTRCLVPDCYTILQLQWQPAHREDADDQREFLGHTNFCIGLRNAGTCYLVKNHSCAKDLHLYCRFR